MKKNQTIEHDSFLAELRKLNIEDLLLVYIEAKTGNYANSDKVPYGYIKAMFAIGLDLNSIYATQIIDKSFTQGIQV